MNIVARARTGATRIPTPTRRRRLTDRQARTRRVLAAMLAKASRYTPVDAYGHPRAASAVSTRRRAAA